MPNTEPERADATPEQAGAPRINRRSLLRGGVLLGMGAVGAATWALTEEGGTPRAMVPAGHATRRNPTADATVAPAVTSESVDGVTLPVARWVVEENTKPGTLQWILVAPQPVEAYASQVSAVAGDTVDLFTDWPSPFRVELYRMGWYGGLGGRLVWATGTVEPQSQPPSVFTPGINMVECHWSPSLSVAVPPEWPTGMYLFKFTSIDGQGEGYVPLCIRDDSSTAAHVIMSAVTTWQAYNSYGGYSLYKSPSGNANRSRVVSFDRPYRNPSTENDFFGNEFPLVFLAESLGLDVAYITNIDLHTTPGSLLDHRCLVSLGHDEYWSTAMRDGATAAVDGGTNLAFLGANAVYRHIRLEPSPLGANRHQVCYKTDFMKEDPLWGIDPSEVTSNWPDGPVPSPEQSLVGIQYADVDANADAVISDPTFWALAGTGLSAGDRLPKAVQGEYDCHQPGLGGPANVTVFSHSPVLNRGPGRWADMAYYTRAGGGGVLATGNSAFIGQLADSPKIPGAVSPPTVGVTPVFTQIVKNMFATFGAGPASVTQPSS